MFRVTSQNNINEYADSVTGFIKKCIDNAIPIVFRMYQNQKPWIDSSLVEKLKESDAVYKHSKVIRDN
jgi:hypothetical protein